LSAGPTSISEAPVTLSYQLGFAEHVRALWAINSARPIERWLKRISLLCLVLGFALPVAGVLSVNIGVFLLFVPLFVYPFGWLFPIYVAWLQRRGGKAWQGELRYSFGPVIVARGQGMESSISWKAITRVAESKHFFLLFMSNQCAVILPKRAIGDPLKVSHLRSVFRARAGISPTDPEAVSPSAPSGAKPSVVEVKFSWGTREGYRAVRAMTKHGPALWPWYLIIFLLIASTSGQSVFKQWSTQGWAGIDLIQLAWTAALVVIFLAITPLASLWSAWSYRRSSRTADGEQFIAFRDDGLELAGPLYRGHIAWGSIMKAVETPEFLLLYLTRIQGLFVPLRVMDPASREKLRLLTKAQLGSAFLT
jgi:YcxB-like protein